jgi:hypothetical protein
VAPLDAARVAVDDELAREEDDRAAGFAGALARVDAVVRAWAGRAGAARLAPVAFGVLVDFVSSGVMLPFETVARGLVERVAVGFADAVVPPPSPPWRGSQWSPTFSWVCRSLA